MYDVLILGGGPVGSRAAHKLAEIGYRVLVLEKKQRTGERVCCTGILSGECITSFAVDSNLILTGINSGILFSPTGKEFRLCWEKPHSYIVDRAAFNAAMANRARDKGAEYILNCSASNVEIRDDRVRVETSCLGEKRFFEARAAVIADGFGSKLAAGLGLGRVDDFVTAVQAEVETMGVNETEVYFNQEVAPGFFAWLAPTLPGRALIGLGTRYKPGQYLRRLMSSLLAQGRITSDEVGICHRAIPLKPLPRTYMERVLIVGDAAGQVKPTTGGGIYYGLLCADIAVKTLHQAFEKGNLSARSMARYEQEWKMKLGRELRMDYWARKFYRRLSNKQIEKIFDIMKTINLNENLLMSEKFVDWHGEIVMKLLRYGTVSKAFKIIRNPLRG